MEVALLQEMARDREICIRFLKKKLEGQDKKAKLLKKEFDEISERKEKEHEANRSQLMQLWKDYDGMLCRYQDAKDELDTRRQQQGNGDGEESQQSTNVYTEIMKEVVIAAEKTTEVSNGSGDSNYVVRMQSQLCKAMHGMGVMETQRQMTKGQVEHMQKKAKDVVTEMVEERSSVELKMVNDLIVADTSKREVDGKRTLQHETFSKQKNDLMEKIERQIDEANEDFSESNAENDEEEEEAKEELKEVLEQGREEAERLEKLNKEAEEKIEALKIKASLAQGQDVVKDLVTSIEEEFAERDGSDDEGSDGSY